MDLDKVNSLKDQGNKAYSGGKYDEAIGLYKEALKSLGSVDLENSKIAAILYSNISQAHLQKKDYSRAIESATESLKFDPSFMKSNLRRATANIELKNFPDAMADLRLIFLHEPNSKAAKDLMRRCSDKPKMKLELHNLYAKHYVRSALKKSATQIVNPQNGVRPLAFLQIALLRQLFLSTKGLGASNEFFRESCVSSSFNQRILIILIGWIVRQFMWLRYAHSPIAVVFSDDTFRLVYYLLRPGTLGLGILLQHYMCDETLLLSKYSEVFLTKEGMLPAKTADEVDLNVMNYYSDDMTRLIYTPELAKFSKIKFPKATALTFDAKQKVTSNFLKLWNKNEWPIESLVFVYGLPDLQVLKQFDGVISSKVKNMFIRFAEENQAFNKSTYTKLCSNLSTLNSVFPNLNDVTFTQWYRFEVWDSPTFVQAMTLIRKAYETITTKPEWFSKLKVQIFVAFKASFRTEFKIDIKVLERAVESLCQKHPDMKIRLCGPRHYDGWWAKTVGAHAVIEFENKTACFEVAFLAIASGNNFNF